MYIDFYVVGYFRQTRKLKMIDEMNPAYVEKKGILIKLALGAVFSSNQYRVASKLVARKLSEGNITIILKCYVCATWHVP